MKNVIIAGAGGCAREVLQWIKDINKAKKTWHIKGFIADDKDTAFNGIECDVPIISTVRDYIPQKDDCFVCAIGSPNAKRLVTGLLASKGAEFVSVIHPKAIISDGCVIGTGFIAYPYSVVSPKAKIGDFVTLLSSTIGYNSSVGSYSTISSYCHIGNRVTTGAFCNLGSHVCIEDDILIGNNVFAGAGSIITQEFGSGAKLFGNPASKVDI
ncbi:MAG: sugar O-acyltransferase [Candidatus Fimivivens sp.]|nr:sugar O-acyltransferase [Candidatus Fimivivens sp.]